MCVSVLRSLQQNGGSLLIHKQAMDGVTIAVAKREKIVLQFV